MTFTYIFLAFLLLGLFTQFFLAQRQMRSAIRHQHQVPEGFENAISLADHQKAAQYTTAKLKLSWIETVASQSLLITLTLFGLLYALHQGLLQYFPAGVWQQIALLIALSFLSSLVDLPFSWYKQFRLEESFGFNRMTQTLFWLDFLKGSLLSLVIGIPLLWVVLTLMQGAGQFWWLYAWVFLVVFILLATWIVPVWIAPLFNKFKPLDDGPLKTSIQLLLDRCGFVSKGLFVMDGSKRSAHGNAYFTGIGKNKRIVFFDTLIEKLSPPEIEAVLAHELGHFKKNHVRKRMILTFLMSLIGLALLGWLSNQVWFYESLGVFPERDGNNAGLALALFSLTIPVFTFFITPLGSLLSRKHEFEADAFAAEKTNAQNLVSALIKLYQDNAATLTPDRLYSAFYDSHPPAPIRIAHLNQLGQATS
jgi:STE24 endopeptidase